MLDAAFLFWESISVNLGVYVLSLGIQLSRGDGWDPLTGLTKPHICFCHKPGPGFRTSHVLIFFNSVSADKMGGDCSFCRY